MSLSISHKRALPQVLCLSAWLVCQTATAANSTSADTARDKGADSFPLQSQITASNNDVYTQLLLLLDINQQNLERTVLVLKSRDGALYLAEDDLRAVRVLIPPSAPVEFKGTRFLRLNSLPINSIVLDEVAQTLTLELRPEAFVGSSSESARVNSPVPTMATPGMFLNYDVNATYDGKHRSYAGMFETGFFSRIGHAVSNFAVRSDEYQHNAVRLDTTLTIDRPSRATSLRLGDAISRPATGWGNASRFGGIQYATNYSVNPGLITLPMRSFNAQAALPSTVDVFVNNVFVSRREVLPGPFSIKDLPVISGSGNVSMVVRDLAGREQVINQPFYSSPSILSKGVVDFSFEAGALRQNYGLKNQDYGQMFGSGTVRVGASEGITAETHLEILAGGKAVAGVNLLSVLSTHGTVNASLATSRSEKGRGRLWGLGFDLQSSNLGFGVRSQLSDPLFLQGSDSELLAHARRLTSANVSVGIGGGGSLGAFYLRQQTLGQSPLELLSLNYSLSLGRYGSVSIAGFKSLSRSASDTAPSIDSNVLKGRASQSISLSWSLPLSGAVSAHASHAYSRDGERVSQLQVQSNLDPVSGYGYRLQTGKNTPQQAGLLLENRIGNYSVEVASFRGNSGARAAMSGGLAVLGGAAFATRRIRDSFGVVQLPDLPNVRIYVDNQLAARTDATGNALLPYLRAYDKNVVRVEQADLEMDVKVGSLEMVGVPYARSGIVLRFPLSHSYGAMLSLVTVDGKVLLPGTMVSVGGQTEVFPVGMDGAVYITGLMLENRLWATWPGGACSALVRFNKTDDPLPNLGKFVCATD